MTRTLLMFLLAACQPEPCEPIPAQWWPTGGPYYYCGKDDYDQYKVAVIGVTADEVWVQCVCRDDQ